MVAVFRTGRDQAGELGYLPWEIALATQAENMVECRHQAGVMDPENHSLDWELADYEHTVCEPTVSRLPILDLENHSLD